MAKTIDELITEYGIEPRYTKHECAELGERPTSGPIISIGGVQYKGSQKIEWSLGHFEDIETIIQDLKYCPFCGIKLEKS